MNPYTHRQRLHKQSQRPSVDDTRLKLNTERCEQHGKDYEGIHLSGDYRCYVWHAIVRVGPNFEAREHAFVNIEIPSAVPVTTASAGLFVHGLALRPASDVIANDVG